jgi:uncharacterized protein YkwD
LRAGRFLASRLRFPSCVVLCAFTLCPSLHGQESRSTQERALFESANRERAARHLPELRWDAQLASAAKAHAEWMARRGTLSHQFSGEATLEERLARAGAQFSMAAENIAEGPNAGEIHDGWMHSPPHRENLLNPRLNALGVAVATRGGQLFAVQDFSEAVASLSLNEQERKVSSLLAAEGLSVSKNSKDARKTCAMERGWAGPRPRGVVRFETAELSELPSGVVQRIQAMKADSAAVGACAAGDQGAFVRFRIAILLY